MLTVTAWAVTLLLATTTVAYLWRWRMGNKSALGWSIVFGYGTLLYLYILSSLYVLIISRYAVRFFIALVAATHLLRSIDVIMARRQRR